MWEKTQKWNLGASGFQSPQTLSASLNTKYGPRAAPLYIPLQSQQVSIPLWGFSIRVVLENNTFSDIFLPWFLPPNPRPDS